MITLQTLMLVALGILLAALAVIAILPAYRSRIQRLTTDHIRRSVPLTEAEIRADKDKLRAQYAIRVHKLEAQGEQQKLSAARQRIEMNRRDARITELEGDLDKLESALEENVNARRVLEHTVTDRLPRLEQQLESARGMIVDRDHEMVSLRSETTRSVRALDEAMQMNAQQRAELERAASSVSARAQQPREAYDSRFEAEMALRSEIEALRAKTREQARLISQQRGAQASGSDADTEVEKLTRERDDAEAVLNSAREAAESGSFDRAAAEAQARELTARIEEHVTEIARLEAALAVYESANEGGDKKAIAQGNRLASRAKINALQVQVTQQTESIHRLRAELAVSNERLARQAAQFMEEMKRLGSGTVPTGVDPRRKRDAGGRRSLAERIGQPRSGTVAEAPPRDGAAERGSGGKVSEYIKALNDDAKAPSTAEATVETPADGAGKPNGAAEHANGAAPVKRKLRLLERISGVKA